MKFSFDLPWYAALILGIITAYLGYYAKRIVSKDNSQVELVKQAIDRQNSLDRRQDSLMDTFQQEIKRFNDDIFQIREELNEERRRNMSLQTQVEVLTLENRELKALMDELKKENISLKQKLKQFNKS
ncbi:hypothetical protein Goe26_00810 [Bacillus phage vB_BsuM-Goe26]|nr:hypothetical protein Goe26_00810 [Bacillus phage vB_BsuM-Goe26]